MKEKRFIHSCVEYFRFCIHVCACDRGPVCLRKIQLIRSQIILWICENIVGVCVNVCSKWRVGFLYWLRVLLLHFHIPFWDWRRFLSTEQFCQSVCVCVSFVNSTISTHKHRWKNRCHIELYNTMLSCGIRQGFSPNFTLPLPFFSHSSPPLFTIYWYTAASTIGIIMHINCGMNPS